MKKIAVTGMLALALTALVATSALAAPPGAPGRGMGPGQGYARAQISPEQIAKFREARAKFLLETLELRKAMAVKRVELSTLWAQPKPDQAKIQALSDQMADLGAALAKKRNAYQAANPGVFGPGFGNRGGFGRGFHRGPGGGFQGGPGGGFQRGPGGPGFGGCPGFGARF